MDAEEAKKVLKEMDPNALFEELDKRGVLSQYRASIERETQEHQKRSGAKDIAVLSPFDAATELLRERSGALKGFWDAEEATALAHLEWIANLIDSDRLKDKYAGYIYHHRGRGGKSVMKFIESLYAGGSRQPQEDVFYEPKK